VDHVDDTVSIALESPRQPGARRLLDGSTADAQRLYPPESNFLLDLSALERPEVAFYVARLGVGVGGTAVGIAALVVDSEPTTDAAGERAELKRMFVDPDARGRGVGGALLTRIEADAAARGIREIVLETGDLNHAAQALYRRHGYREIAQFGQYVGGLHAVCFAKPISRLEPADRAPA